MHLEGSCHCKAVTFSLESPHPYPFNRCYCSICRKTAGSGGYGINLSGVYSTLRIHSGETSINTYQAKMGDKTSTGIRHFCRECGSALWLYDPTWPELVHPHASAIDTPLPTPPEVVHLMLGSKPEWVQVDQSLVHQNFEEYPEESIADWHQKRGLEC
ncbi:GFA family protein [Pokkaliibacter sp. CJK22405]|uniref:GFA family protein n=1 Tax=Pokkaliibacter sp. CJK22405 TaxID=3384615 RepID=UPI003984804B